MIILVFDDDNEVSGVLIKKLIPLVAYTGLCSLLYETDETQEWGFTKRLLRFGIRNFFNML